MRRRRSKFDPFAKEIQELLEQGHTYKGVHELLQNEYALDATYDGFYHWIMKGQGQYLKQLNQQESTVDQARKVTEVGIKSDALHLNKELSKSLKKSRIALRTHDEDINGIVKQREELIDLPFDVNDFGSNLRHIMASIYIGMQNCSPTSKEPNVSKYQQFCMLYGTMLKTYTDTIKVVDGSNPYTFNFNIKVKDIKEIPSPAELFKSEKKIKVSDLIDYKELPNERLDEKAEDIQSESEGEGPASV